MSLQSKIWDGRVPVLFSMVSNEIISKKEPISIFLSLPRNGYLPLVTHKVYAHFAPYVPALAEISFESGGDTLKWHHPVGVLYDLYNSQKNDAVWKVTVHFESYPQDADKTARCHEMNNKRTYFNAFKQAVFLSLPLNVPIRWLIRNAISIDGFLYVVIVAFSQ